MRSLTFLLLLLLILFTFRKSIARSFRTLLVAVIALFGSLLFAAIVACEMGGSWGLVGLLIAFIFLMPQIRRLLERMFPPKEKTRSE